MININDIIYIVADYFKITKNDILGKSRKQVFVYPRYIAIYISRKYLPFLKLQDFVLPFRRDHSVILTAEAKIGSYLTSKDLRLKENTYNDILSIQKIIKKQGFQLTHKVEELDFNKINTFNDFYPGYTITLSL